MEEIEKEIEIENEDEDKVDRFCSGCGFEAKQSQDFQECPQCGKSLRDISQRATG